MSRYIFVFLAFCLSFCNEYNFGKSSKVDSKNKNGAIDSAQLNRSTHLDSIHRENSKTILLAGSDINKASVSKTDSAIWISQNKYLDYRIFGYERPDTISRRMILFSVFTNDVEGNPFNCPLGAYYHSGAMKDMTLKYISSEGNFVKAGFIKKEDTSSIVYFEKKWVEFED